MKQEDKYADSTLSVIDYIVGFPCVLSYSSLLKQITLTFSASFHMAFFPIASVFSLFLSFFHFEASF